MSFGPLAPDPQMPVTRTVQVNSRGGDQGGPGALTATLVAIAAFFVLLLVIGKPWRRSKLPRAKATIYAPDGDDQGDQGDRADQG